MRALIQRVSQASVTIENKIFSEINAGMLILLCVMEEDTESDLNLMVKKCSALRIFDDDNGIMNLDIKTISGEILVVSQFTLAGNVKKGNRPSYFTAAKSEKSLPFYNKFCEEIEKLTGCIVKTGVFGADMKVSLINDGPVTIIIDTANF